MHVNPLLLNFEDKSLQTFFSCSHQSMLIADVEFKTVLEVNDAAINSCGYDKEEIFLQSVEKIIPQKEQQKLLQLADASFTAQKTLKKEITLISKSGKIIYAEAVISAILYKGKEARLLTMTDVTEKKLYRNLLEEFIDTEISLQDKNQKLKTIACMNFHLARKPLANILGLVNVMDQSTIDDKTLSEAIEFLRESGNELDELIKNIDPQEY